MGMSRDRGNGSVADKNVGRSERPASIAVVAWVIIATNGLVLVLVCMMALLAFLVPDAVYGAAERAGKSPTVLAELSVVGGGVGIVLAAGILAGLNWSRWAYLLFMPVRTTVGWVLYSFGVGVVLDVTFYIIVLVILTRPAAVEFFAGPLSWGKREGSDG